MPVTGAASHPGANGDSAVMRRSNREGGVDPIGGSGVPGAEPGGGVYGGNGGAAAGGTAREAAAAAAHVTATAMATMPRARFSARGRVRAIGSSSMT